jgi:hypothetical protein
VTSVHFETLLTRRFGVQWTPRKDGNGYEIESVPEALIKALSSRRIAIDSRVQEKLIPEFVEEYGRMPNQRELASMYQGANLALRHGKDGLVDWKATRELWAERCIERAGERLESVAPRAWGYGDPGSREAGDPEPGPDARARVARMALEAVQSARPTWRRADLLAAVCRLMPRVAMDPAEAVRGVESLTDEILAGRFGRVVSLEAPGPVEIPAELMRADGKSVFERHGGGRYATAGRLALEEEIVSLARGRAPAVTRELAAELLGAGVGELEDALYGRMADAMERTTATEVRLDQAAIVWHMVTSGNQVDVVNAAAGSGKTTLASMEARIWEEAGGDVIGIAPSQSATQTLSAGIERSLNTAQFLGHVPGERGARGAVAVSAGSLAVVDEGSMVSTADLADVLRHISARGGKISLLGDVHQLQAVESGGGFSMLARLLGYASLPQPVRMREQWERDASARLRTGDLSSLGEYDEHGRIRGGSQEAMLEAAARAYVALAGEGKDALLVVSTHELRHELARRVQGYLADRGVVDTRVTTRLGSGQGAGAGDVVVCTANDNRVSTGDGKTLNNHGLFLVEQIAGREMTLRRVLDAAPDGGRVLAEESFTYADTSRFELGYAVTQHAAQSRTVSTGLAVVSGSETAEGAYVALTRGRDRNLVYVFSESPRKADPAPGFKPAEEIGRHERLSSYRAGEQDFIRSTSEDALAVLAEVFSRSGEELAATEYQARQLAQADNLAELGTVWSALTGRVHEARYADVAREASGGTLEDTHTARWLHRSMRNAELAGLGAEQVVREVVARSPLTGSRDTAAVIDYRLCRATEGLVPVEVRPFADQVPYVDSAPLQRFLGELATAMDERQARIGEHAARHPEHWADALGPVPEEPVARLEWERRAGQVGAYSEMFAFNHPTESIGAEPGPISPDKRAMWYQAHVALDGRTGHEVGDMSDGALELRVRSFQAETAWAPRDVSLALGAVRRDLGDAQIEAVNRDAEARTARERGDGELAARHEELAASARAREQAYAGHEQVLAGLAGDRAQWDAATGRQRRVAVAAHRELARRHPDRELEPIKSAEPEPVRDTDTELDVERLRAERAEFADRLAERESMRVPEEDHEYGDSGFAFRPDDGRDHGPILVPPRHEIEPSDSAGSGGGDSGIIGYRQRIGPAGRGEFLRDHSCPPSSGVPNAGRQRAPTYSTGIAPRLTGSRLAAACASTASTRRPAGTAMSPSLATPSGVTSTRPRRTPGNRPRPRTAGSSRTLQPPRRPRPTRRHERSSSYAGSGGAQNAMARSRRA